MTRILRLLVLSLMAAAALPVPSFAMLAPAEETQQQEVRDADARTVQTALENKLVRDRLHKLGMTDKEIEARMARLSVEQKHRLAKDIEKMNPGGADLGGVLVAVVLVLLIIYLLERI